MYQLIIDKWQAKKQRVIRRSFRNHKFSRSYSVSEDMSCLPPPLFSLPDIIEQMPAARIYQDLDSIEYKRIAEARAPQVSIFRLEKASVFSRSDAVWYRDKFFHAEIHRHDIDRHDIKNRNFYCEKNENGWIFHSPKGLSRRRLRGLSLSLLKEHSHNYYHFLSECIPKLLLFQKEVFPNLSCPDTINILVDASVPAQCLELLEQLTTFSYRLIKVSDFETVECEDIIYCSPFFYSLDNTSFPVFNPDDFYVSGCAIELLVSKVRERFPQTGEPDRLIFLPRKSRQLRRIENALEIEEALDSLGFERIYPDEYSLEEQVRLFSSAKCVVGGSGAAFTNLIFMQAGTSAVAFTPNLKLTNHFLFQQHATTAGVDLFHILSESSSEKENLHDAIAVDVTKLIDLLRKILGL